MTDEEAALRAAVLERPDDDFPRLVYAAWCDAQADEITRLHGELIRVQISLANLVADQRQQHEYPLRFRSETLERKHGKQWGWRMAELVKELQYDRGFIELVALPARRFLELAQTLRGLAPIRHVILTDVREVAKELFQSPQLAGLRSLDLAENGLGDEEVRLLAASPYLQQLRWLSLAWNQVGTVGAAALAESPNLRQLAYVWFLQNEVEPNERYAHDGGTIVDSWMPPDGLALEARYGPLPWLHFDAKSVTQTTPDRFRGAFDDQKSSAGR